MRSRNVLPVAALVLLAGLITVTGCDISLFYGPRPATGTDGDSTPANTVEDSAVLAIVEPAGTETYHPGSEVPVRWIGTIESTSVAIELYRNGQPAVTIAAGAPNTGSFDWVIPEDFDASPETPDDYRISVRTQIPDHTPGDLFVQAFSEPFTITPSTTGGLTDVTVGQRSISITVTDNGQQIDGDTVDIILNGITVITGHVLVGPPGTQIELSLLAGDNTLEIVAINEGSVSPNTAELAISDVVLGEMLQEWRLLAGERGSLTITAP